MPAVALIEKAKQDWMIALARVGSDSKRHARAVVEGVLTRMVGLTLEAVGCQAPIGARCDVINSDGERVETEVVGFSGDSLYLMPTSEVRGLVPNARVIPTWHGSDVPVGPELLGRVIDGRGRPLDARGAVRTRNKFALQGREINPLARTPIREELDVGVRAINALCPIGRGQRMGLFAGSGVGKSVLLGMMTRYTEADIVVVGLIGERGREVKEFVQEILGQQGLKKAVVVAAPADSSPLMRIHGAMRATSIAGYFRDQGNNVLLLMDSLTRFAQAQREIALAIGEPPATKGYPPSVFARLPQLVERAGNGGAERRVDYRILYGFGGRGRSCRPDRRRRARHTGRAYCAVAAAGGNRGLSGDRYRGFDQSPDTADYHLRAHGYDAEFQGDLQPLPAKSRFD